MGSASVGIQERRALLVQGIVQGVGFRPHVYRLAARHGLGGFVRNETGGVRVEVEGDPAAVEAFVDALRAFPPAGARLAPLLAETRAPRGQREFRIEPSLEKEASTPSVSPDVATCDACLR